MMTMLHGLHAIAAQRGDGLRPELLKAITPSPVGIDIGMMMRAAPARADNQRDERLPPPATTIVPL